MRYHPELEEFREVLKAAGKYDLEAIARLWLSEGIPYAFRETAGIYDELRFWLACRLGVNGKDVTIVGSGRIGFSMSPRKFGATFGDNSDLDLSVVNLCLFEKCSREAQKFKEDFVSGELRGSDTQNNNWADTIKYLDNNLRSGFVDTFKIPAGKLSAPTILSIKDSMYRAGEMLKVTNGVPVFTKVTARVYRDWDALVERVAFNLGSAVVN